MTAYYNEMDPKAAAWLRELIARDLIAPGDVDERSIEDVTPNDLKPYTQCHFFAGIGTWSYALRQAGWSDDRPVWTGSCPCQPFSAAGKGAGFADERHLWPAWDWLIEFCSPAVIFGEQVASKDAEPWLDLVQADLEGLGYALGAVPFPSAGVGAPHIRDRLYWVAHAELPEEPRQRPVGGAAVREQEAAGLAGGRMADGLDRRNGDAGLLREPPAVPGAVGLGDDERQGQQIILGAGSLPPDAVGAASGAAAQRAGADSEGCPGPTNGLWRDADWLLCRDGKWRPVEPGTFPLAHGAPARVGRLRGYGNAINAQAAEAFVRSYLEAIA